MSQFPCVIEGRVPCPKCVTIFSGFFEYCEPYSFDMETMRNIVSAYGGLDNDDSDDKFKVLLRATVGSCPSAWRFLAQSSHQESSVSSATREVMKFTDDEIKEMAGDIIDAESSSCYHYTINEFPLDLLWMSIATSWTMPYLSRVALVTFAQKYCAHCVVKESTNEELGAIIARGQLSLLRCCPPKPSRSGDIVQQLINDMINIIGTTIGDGTYGNS